MARGDRVKAWMGHTNPWAVESADQAVPWCSRSPWAPIPQHRQRLACSQSARPAVVRRWT